MQQWAFVTIGQSPRDDILPDLLPEAAAPAVRQVGVLDGLDDAEIAAGAPADEDEERLCTRLADGREVVIAKRWTAQRLQVLVDALDAEDVDLIVLLCTGYFDGLKARTLLIEPQRLVDHTVDALAEGGRRVGVLVPLASQVPEFARRGGARWPVTVSHASPYAPGRFAEAAGELGDAELIVMHCMGYDEAMRREVAAAAGRPVLLARRLLAATVAQFV